MDTKKFMAVFAVLVMAFAATACIVSAESDSEAVTLEDKGTVELDVNGTFNDNKTELAKLGITTSDSWVKVTTGEYQGYKLILNNVVYKTAMATALKVKSTSTDFKVLYVECNGTNRFVSTGLDDNNENTCIDASGENVGICFVGDGELTAISDNEKAISSVAIYALYFGVKRCTIHAESSDLSISASSPEQYYYSIAICIEDQGGFEILDGARVYATAGNIKSTDNTATTYLTSVGLASRGDYKIKSFIMKDSYLCLAGGNVYASASNAGRSMGAVIGGDSDITDSTIIATSGDVSLLTSRSGFTEGIQFNSVDAEGLTIVATSGDVYIKAADSGPSMHSAGIHLSVMVGNNVKFVDSNIFAYGGESRTDVKNPSLNISAGFYNTSSDHNEFNFEGSLLDVAGSESEENSYGFKVVRETNYSTVVGKLVLKDSEFNAYGAKSALQVKDIDCTDPKWCEYEMNGKWYKTTPTELIKMTDATSVSVGFNFYVCLKSSDEEPAERIVERISGDTYKLPKCTFEAPEGKHFKCWEVDGKQYDVGETIPVEYYAVATAVWENDHSGGNNNTMAIAIALIAVGALAAVGALMIFVPRR